MSLARYARSTTCLPTTVMKTIRQLLLFSLLSSVCSFVCHAANHMVQSGQSLQTTLTNAASGDLVLLQDGFYDEDCVLANKAITIKSITILNSPSFDGVCRTNRPGTSGRLLGPELFLVRCASTPPAGTRSFPLLTEMALTPYRLPSIFPSLI